MGNVAVTDYFIIDGTSTSYELREEIKNQGGYWIPHLKTWAINGLEKEDDAYKVLTAAGLKLQYRRDRVE